MTLPVQFRPEAGRDLDTAAAWYEAERPGLGRRFLTEFSNLIGRISAGSAQFPTVEPGIRRGLVRRFPYGVYFAIEDEMIVVLAILHLHREPDAWKRRL